MHAALAATVAFLLGLAAPARAHTVPYTYVADNMTVFDGSGVVVTDITIDGTIDRTTMTWSIDSASGWWGVAPTFSNGLLYGPGTYTYTTVWGNPVQFTVGPNQLGSTIEMQWNGNRMSVVNVWDPVSYLVHPSLWQATDPDGDGTPGIRQIDSAFSSFTFGIFDRVAPGAGTVDPAAVHTHLTVAEPRPAALALLGLAVSGVLLGTHRR
ncbi:MAG: hypothetical protein D6776_01655 [Planctomycetota bacterium]|nr:MAG: hypothetical protein D6776_01655 [Planctomycetota bacterium]